MNRLKYLREEKDLTQSDVAKFFRILLNVYTHIDNNSKKKCENLINNYLKSSQ